MSVFATLSQLFSDNHHRNLTHQILICFRLCPIFHPRFSHPFRNPITLSMVLVVYICGFCKCQLVTQSIRVVDVLGQITLSFHHHFFFSLLTFFISLSGHKLLNIYTSDAIYGISNSNKSLFRLWLQSISLPQFADDSIKTL